MRSREFPFEIAIAVLLGIIVYLNLGVAERVLVPVPELETMPAPVVRVPQPLADLTLEPEPVPEGLTPRFYPEGELMAYRNLFVVTDPFLTRPAEEPYFPELVAEVPVVEAPVEVEITPPEAPVFAPEIEVVETRPPALALQGIVLSEEGQAIILKIDNRIEIVSTQQPLPDGMKIVKLDQKSVVLDYFGREYQLALDD